MDWSLGAQLREHRLAAGLTQEGLAERAGISSRAVGALERGDRRFPHKYTVNRLADALALTDEDRARLAAGARRPVASRRVRSANGVPRQIPPDIAHFTGRDEEVSSVSALLEPSANTVVVSGMGGVGKTALAVHVGHLVADRFPDGQVYLDLRGSGAPVVAREALGQLMRALEMTDDELPADMAEAAARYRSTLAGRRLLLILDNAASAEQVFPLLPGSGGSAAIITSRRELIALPQIHSLRLDVLPEHDAVQLLAATIGETRVDADSEAAAAVVRHCGRLPLAIHVAGARLAVRPAWTLADLAFRLTDQRRRLDELERDDLGVRASFAMTIDHLDKLDAYAFTLLGLLDSPTISLPIAARLLDLAERHTERILDRLADAHLVLPAAPGWYRIHDLLHAYARELADETVSDLDRNAAHGRTLRLLIAVAWRSLMLADQTGFRGSLAEEAWMADAPTFRNAGEAFDWLDDHRHLLVDISRAHGVLPELVVRLSIGLIRFYCVRGHWQDWAHVARAALHAAQVSSGGLVTAIARMDLGLALASLTHSQCGEHDEAINHLEQSLTEYRALANADGLALCLTNMADLHAMTGDLAAGITYGEEALAIYEGRHNPNGQAIACENLGNLYRELGDWERALAFLERSLCHYEEVGNHLFSAHVLHGIGASHRAAGRYRQALTATQRSAELFRSAGDQVGELAAVEAAGRLHVDLGDSATASEVLRAGLDLAQKRGNRRQQISIQQHLNTATKSVNGRGEA